jgi:hypothetical protein
LKRKIRLKDVKKGSLMYRLLGLNALDDPNSDLRKMCDKIAKGDKMIEDCDMYQTQLCCYYWRKYGEDECRYRKSHSVRCLIKENVK